MTSRTTHAPNGQRLKCLTVIDEYTRECPAIDVSGRIRPGRVMELLSKLVSTHGAPSYLRSRSDNRREFVSRAVLRWLTQANIDTAHIDPGKPWQNGSNESFNGKFRHECLSMQWFNNRTDAKILIENFRRDYNKICPHSSLGQLTPSLDGIDVPKWSCLGSEGIRYTFHPSLGTLPARLLVFPSPQFMPRIPCEFERKFVGSIAPAVRIS